GVTGGMFHLVTHAFFKALLFLGAGSVMHAMGGVIDMRQFSGLRKVMPQTHATFLIGSLALAGLFSLSGVWSKDAILSAAHEASIASAEGAHSGEPSAETGEHPAARPEPKLLGLSRPALFTLLFWMGTFTALLTAFYTFRAFFMTFYGPEKIPHEAGHHAHESPPVMCIPLWILAVGAVFLGAILDPHLTGIFDGFLGRTIPAEHAGHHRINLFVVGVSTVAAAAGIVAAYVMYASGTSRLPARINALAGPFAELSRNKFYFDEIYAALFVWPLK